MTLGDSILISLSLSFFRDVILVFGGLLVVCSHCSSVVVSLGLGWVWCGVGGGELRYAFEK